MNELSAKHAETERRLRTGVAVAEREIVGELRDLEVAATALESRVEAATEEKRVVLAEVVEAERQIMLWERKIQLEKETQAALDPDVGEDVVSAMRREISRMERRDAELTRRQEQLMKEMERSVYKRELIQTKAKLAKSREKDGGGGREKSRVRFRFDGGAGSRGEEGGDDDGGGETGVSPTRTRDSSNGIRGGGVPNDASPSSSQNARRARRRRRRRRRWRNSERGRKNSPPRGEASNASENASRSRRRKRRECSRGSRRWRRNEKDGDDGGGGVRRLRRGDAAKEKLARAVEDIRADAPHLERALERATLLLSA